MLPEDQGRHCLVCSKTVIDFSAWSQQEILDYLEAGSHKRVCGRFLESQVEHTPAHVPAPQHPDLLPAIVQSNLSFLKKIAAIVVLCFGVMTSAACSYAQTKNPQERRLLGEPAVMPADTAKQAPATDTLQQSPPVIMGKIAPYRPATCDSAKGNNGRKRSKPHKVMSKV